MSVSQEYYSFVFNDLIYVLECESRLFVGNFTSIYLTKNYYETFIFYSFWLVYKIKCTNRLQGTLVPKLTLGPCLKLSVINGHKLNDWIFRITAHIQSKICQYKLLWKTRPSILITADPEQARQMQFRPSGD